jgi:hypothetical protein
MAELLRDDVPAKRRSCETTFLQDDAMPDRRRASSKTARQPDWSILSMNLRRRRPGSKVLPQ